MPEYIEREALIEFIKQNTPNINGETTIECVERAIRTHPAADVVEVVHGKWIGDKNKQVNSSHLFYYDDWCCSICGLYYPERNYEKLGKYCPYCGAKMDGKRKDGDWE